MSKTKGLHTHRFRVNPEEKRFAEAWDRQLTKRDEDFVAYLLSPVPTTPTVIEDRDRIVAATVIQWLGSPVGQGFLRELGYQKRED